MLISIATGVGLQQKVREKISAFNGDIIISHFDTNFSKDSQNPITREQSFYSALKNNPKIKHIQVTAYKSGIIRTAKDFEGVVVKGVGDEYEWRYFNEYLIEGRLPNFKGELNEEILLSSYLVNRLQLNIGDKVVTYFIDEKSDRPYRSRGFDLVGIYNSGFQEFDESYLIADIRHIQFLNRWEENQIGAYELFVSEFSKITETGNDVYYAIDSTLDSQTIREKYDSIFEWLDLFDFNIALIIGIMILVAGINMITCLLVLILERTKMIGILKSLGSSNWSIRKIFLINAMYLIGLGLFWGNLIGLGLLMLQKQFKFITLNPDTYYVTEAPVYLDLSYIVLLNAGTFALCLLMLLIPSYIITRISPVKAIRFE